MKFAFGLFVIGVFFISEGFSAPTSEPEEVSFVNDGRYPYIAYLSSEVNNKKKSCGSAIIRADVLLTAASCVTHKSPTQNVALDDTEHMKVVAGTYNVYKKRNPSVIERGVAKVVVHPDFNGNVKDGHDIAVVVLKESLPLDTSYIKTIKMAENEEHGKFLNQNVKILGWGETEASPDSQDLVYANLQVYSNAECSSMNQNHEEVLKNSQMCYLSYDTSLLASIGPGDEGGPGVRYVDENPANDVLVGIASYYTEVHDVKQDLLGRSSIYTDVAFFRHWIDETANKI